MINPQHICYMQLRIHPKLVEKVFIPNLKVARTDGLVGSRKWLFGTKKGDKTEFET